MIKALAACVVAFSLATAPGIAQSTRQPLDADAALAAIGKPVVSSDGVAMGQIAGIGSNAGVIVLVAELERPLGIGVQVVSIGVDLVARVSDRVELTATADEIRGRLKELESQEL